VLVVVGVSGIHETLESISTFNLLVVTVPLFSNATLADNPLSSKERMVPNAPKYLPLITSTKSPTRTSVSYLGAVVAFGVEKAGALLSFLVDIETRVDSAATVVGLRVTVAASDEGVVLCAGMHLPHITGHVACAYAPNSPLSEHSDGRILEPHNVDSNTPLQSLADVLLVVAETVVAVAGVLYFVNAVGDGIVDSTIGVVGRTSVGVVHTPDTPADCGVEPELLVLR